MLRFSIAIIFLFMSCALIDPPLQKGHAIKGSQFQGCIFLELYDPSVGPFCDRDCLLRKVRNRVKNQGGNIYYPKDFGGKRMYQIMRCEEKRAKSWQNTIMVE